MDAPPGLLDKSRLSERAPLGYSPGVRISELRELVIDLVLIRADQEAEEADRKIAVLEEKIARLEAERESREICDECSEQ